MGKFKPVIFLQIHAAGDTEAQGVRRAARVDRTGAERTGRKARAIETVEEQRTELPLIRREVPSACDQPEPTQSSAGGIPARKVGATLPLWTPKTGSHPP
jgi:hypothetical protein